MNIYDILSANTVTVESLYYHQDIIRKEINRIDDARGTPITYYCNQHLKSGIDSLVIETLITKFNANVNLNLHHNTNTPLCIFFKDNDPKTIIDNISVIKILLKYTSTLSAFISDNKPNLFVPILLSSDLFNEDNILQLFAEFIKNRIAQEDSYKQLGSEALFKMFNELHDGLLHLRASVEHMKLVFSMWYFIDTILFHNRIERDNNVYCLFTSAIDNRNFHLIKMLLTLEIIQDFGPNHQLIQWMFDAYSDQEERLQLDKVFYDSLILDQNKGNNIMIHGIMLNIHNIDKYVQHYNPENRDDLFLGIKILDRYIKHPNHQEIISYLGFNNNIFHFLALYRSYTTQQLMNLFSRDQNFDLLLNQNWFGQTPLKIALLCNNNNFISFIVNKALENINFLAKLRMTYLDHDNNSVGHILAQTILPQQDFMNILSQLEKIGYTTEKILTAQNRFKQTAIFYAVKNVNNVFIDWWQKNKGICDDKDIDGRTLWHHFTTIYIDNTNTDSSNSVQSTQQVYEFLKSAIPQLVHIEDDAGFRPIDTAILMQSSVCDWLLNDYGDSIDFQHQNKDQDTISHIINKNFISGFPSNNLLLTQKEIIDLLIPYHAKIKANYNIKNAAGKRPIDILESAMRNTLAVFIHERISHVVLKQVAILNGKYDSEISTSHTGSSILPLFVHDKVKIVPHAKKETDVALDNTILMFSDDVRQQAANIRTDQLSETVRNQIHILSFDIVYSDINAWGDTTLHYLLSTQILGISTELTCMHVLSIIDPKLRDVVLDTHNQLGQHLIHLAFQAHARHVVEYLFEINPLLMNKPTAEINLPSIATLIAAGFQHRQDTDISAIINNIPKHLYPCDYATTVFAWDEEWFTNTFLKVIKSHPQLSILSSTAINTAIKNYDFLLPYIDHHQTILASEYQYITNYKDIMFVREKDIDAHNNYFPVLGAHIKHLTKEVGYIVHDVNIHIVTSPEHLESVLERYVHHFNFAYYPDRSRIKFFALTYDKHASTLVVFRAKDKTYHALIQDQYLESLVEAYKTRTDKIKQVLFATLKIPENNIYELKVFQQDYLDNNCLLWTLANLKIIEANLFFKRFSCILCIDTRYWMVLRDNINPMILTQIKEDLLEKSPLIVLKIKEYLTTCHNSFCSLNNEDINIENFNHKFLYNVPLSIIKTHKNVVLSDQNIRDIVNNLDTKIFTIADTDPHYEFNTRMLIVIPNHEAGFGTLLAKYIRSYLDYNENTQVQQSTCTFIINIEDHWVTLVISYKNSEYQTYYADSFAGETPSTIINILKEYSIPKYKSVLAMPQHHDNENSGFWAIQNAFNINIILISNTPSLTYGLDHISIVQSQNMLKLDHDKLRQEYKEILEHEAAEYNDILHSNAKILLSDNITYQNTPISDQNIRQIAMSEYGHIFAVHLLDEYNTSDHSLVVIEDDNLALQEQINTFLTEHYHTQTLSTRTIIFNKNSNHWVTLVIALDKNQKVSVYFADSLGDCMPKEINQVLESCLYNYSKTRIVSQVVYTKQQNNSYDCGFWAIQNALYINSMLLGDYDLLWLEDQIERNSYVDFLKIQDLRQKFRSTIEQELKAGNLHSKNIDALKMLEHQLGFIKYTTNCSPLSSVGTLERRKRAICEEDNTQQITVGSISNFEIPENDKINMQLYFDISYLAALQEPSDNKNSKIHNTVKYIGNIYSILSEGPENWSTREEQVIKKHNKNVNALILPGSKDQLLYSLEDIETINSPILFYNNDCSLIVAYDNNHYLIYSQNRDYSTVYKTKDGVTFSQIKQYVSIFFSIYSSQNSGYNIYSLADNIYTHDALKKLENSDIWKKNNAIKSDLQMLLESNNKSIDNIPINIIRKILLFNGKVPDIRILNDNFFSIHQEMISLRIDQIHKAFLYLNAEQLKSLKELIKQYKFPVDQIDLQKIGDTKSKEIKDLISEYNIRMSQKLQNIDQLSLHDIEELTWEILDDYMKLHHIPPELSTASLQNMRTIHKLFVYYTRLHGTALTQASFFIPDLIKAVNYNEYMPLIASAAMTVADMSVNKLYGSLVDKMTPYFNPNTIKILNTIPVTSPIFKVLTIYEIKKLTARLSTMDRTSKDYEIISHKLKEEYATLGLMTLELFNLPLYPLWLGLMIERVYYTGHEIALTYNLDIPFWEEALIGLGFYQDKLRALIEDSSLVSYNLELIDTIKRYFINSDNSSLEIIKIPEIVSRDMKPINESQVPQRIKMVLASKADQSLNTLEAYMQSQVLPIPSTKYAVVTNIQYEDYVINGKRNEFQYALLRDKTLKSNTTIMFHDYSIEEYKKSGPQDEVFIDKIQLSNQTWFRVPKQINCKIFGMMCDNPQRSFVLRNTGNAALYYKDTIQSKIDDNTIWRYIKNIVHIFDAREGNTKISFTNEWGKQLSQQTNQKFFFTVIVQEKFYPKILSFQDSSLSSFELYDYGDMIVPQYFIMDSNNPFIINDNTSKRSIVLISPINNTSHQMIISGTSLHISLNIINNLRSHNSTILGTKDTKYLAISITNNTLIGTKLVLSDVEVYIDHIQGQSNQSIIFFTESNRLFQLKLVGNIIVQDSDHSRLCIAGNYQSQSSVYSKSYNYDELYADYTMIVQDFLLMFKTIQRYKTTNYIQHIKFNDIDDTKYNWYSNSLEEHLSIHSNPFYCTLELATQFDTLEVFNKDRTELKFIGSIYFGAKLQLQDDYFIKKIFINKNKNFEYPEIIQNIDSLSMCDLISSAINGSIVLFSNDVHEWYVIFPFSRNLTINFINYHITEQGICYIPSEYANNNNHNNILEYIVTDSYVDKKIVSICTPDSSEVKTRATRHISEDNDNQITDYLGTTFNTFNILRYFHPKQWIDYIANVGNPKDAQLEKFNNSIVNYTTINSLAQKFDYDNSNIEVEQDLEINNDNDAHIGFTDNIIFNERSDGSTLRPPGYNLINKIWEYFFSTEKKVLIQETITNEEVDLANSMVNSNINSIININNRATNITENLQLNYDSADNSPQHITNTFNVDGNLIFGQLLAHWLFGKNKLLSANQYISPEQERNMVLQNISEEVCTMLNDFTYDNGFVA